MSQRSRPGTGQKPSDPTRMPFEAAEALLWGKATFEQHTHLFKRMQELEQQHKTYDARIQSAVVVAAAAEAATSGVRHLEQQIAAIEADEPNKPFNDWIAAEVEGLKAFVEQNEGVRQRVILLEKQISISEEEANRTTRLAKVLDGLLHRVNEMEARHGADVDRVNVLEKSIKDQITTKYPHLPDRHREQAGFSTPRGQSQDSLRPGIGSEHNMRLPSRRQGQIFRSNDVMELSTRQPDFMRSDRTEDTEIEENSASHQHATSIRASSPRFHEEQQGMPINLPGLPLMSDTQKISARLRVMQRKSIYDPKVSVDQERSRRPLLTTGIKPRPRERQKDGVAEHEIQSISRSHEKIMPQAFDKSGLIAKSPTQEQMIIKLPVNISNRKQEVEQYAPRLTRSQAQAQKAQEQVYDRPSKLVEAQSKVSSRTSKGSKPQQNESTSAPPHDLGKRKRAPPATPQKVNGSPTKRKKPNMRKPIQPANNTKNATKPTQQIESLVQSSHSCIPCVEANIICDQSQPTCGNCKRRRRTKQCAYINQYTSPQQSTRHALPNPQKPITSYTDMSNQNGAKSTTTADECTQSLTKRGPPKSSSAKDDSHATYANRSSRRAKKPTALPPATATQPDWETYQEMVRQGLIHF